MDKPLRELNCRCAPPGKFIRCVQSDEPEACLYFCAKLQINRAPSSNGKEIRLSSG
jgi:hypothetical protein